MPGMPVFSSLRSSAITDHRPGRTSACRSSRFLLLSEAPGELLLAGSHAGPRSGSLAGVPGGLLSWCHGAGCSCSAAPLDRVKESYSLGEAICSPLTPLLELVKGLIGTVGLAGENTPISRCLASAGW